MIISDNDIFHNSWVNLTENTPCYLILFPNSCSTDKQASYEIHGLLGVWCVRVTERANSLHTILSRYMVQIKVNT